MRSYTNITTHRLEQLAKKLGVVCQIRVIEAQEDGRYFVIALDEHPLKQSVALGFTDEQAINTLKRRTWERYAMRGEPTRLESAP